MDDNNNNYNNIGPKQTMVPDMGVVEVEGVGKEAQEVAVAAATMNQHTIDTLLLEPFHYINSVPGKDVRGTLIDCFQYWFLVPTNDNEKDGAIVRNDDVTTPVTQPTANHNNTSSTSGSNILASIKEIVANLHHASLLIDDIEDNSKLRRGIPVAHHIFGIPNTINCANYIYFMALQQCSTLSIQYNQPIIVQIYITELLNLHRGQGYDILWRDTNTCPNEEEYLTMVCDKTGGLFRLAVNILQIFATNIQYKVYNFIPLVNNMAMYFQIRDDLINLADEEYMKSKSFCEDITEGKFSYPIVHAIQYQKEKYKQLLYILKQRTEDDDVKRYAQSLLKDMGSLEYTRQKCTTLKDAICNEIQQIGNNPQLILLMNQLHIQLEQMVVSTTTTSSSINAAITNNNTTATTISPTYISNTERKSSHDIDEP